MLRDRCCREMDHAFAEGRLVSKQRQAVLVPVLEMSQAMSPSDAAREGQRAKNRNHDEHESEDTQRICGGGCAGEHDDG